MITSRSVLTVAVAVAAALCTCVMAQVGTISERFVDFKYDEESRTFLARDKQSGEQVVVVQRRRLDSESEILNGQHYFPYLPRHEGIQFGFAIEYGGRTVTTVMERVPSPSPSLYQLLSESIQNQLPIDQFVMLFAQIVHAVDHCHRHGVEHGSITINSFLVIADNSVKLSHPLPYDLRTRSSSATVDVFDLGHVLIRLLAVTVPSLPTQVQSIHLIRDVINLVVPQANDAISMVLYSTYLVVESVLKDDRPAIIVLYLALILEQQHGAGTVPYFPDVLNIFGLHPIPELGTAQFAALRLIAHMIDPDLSTRWSMDRIVQFIYLVHTNP